MLRNSTKNFDDDLTSPTTTLIDHRNIMKPNINNLIQPPDTDRIIDANDKKQQGEDIVEADVSETSFVNQSPNELEETL